MFKSPCLCLSSSPCTSSNGREKPEGPRSCAFVSFPLKFQIDSEIAGVCRCGGLEPTMCTDTQFCAPMHKVGNLKLILHEKPGPGHVPGPGLFV